ncbi:MAG: fluoride efflux transporter CrcB [Gammaproteobacteria bacterium]|nr:fluoride efflux transporter CrcB [Gammaproteobacteria bacterium]MDH3751954.1 fluoride efflux transporter CrcB [Gammaproteobacteria bacterium]MDH3805758.1 fluoride efflux transporter CrcB [Gammaproteobacteria bacterium]
MRIVLWSYVFVAIGGALGAMARFALNVMLQRDIAFPWGTLSANLSGCLAMGVIAHLVASSAWFNEAGIVPDQYRLLFAIGFCGSFTTLSALVMELHTMLQRNEIANSFAYLMATMIGGFACFYIGFIATRTLRSLPVSS